MKKWSRKLDPFAQREAKKYTNPIPSRECIMDLLSKSKTPLSQKQIISFFGLSTDFSKEAFRRRLCAMIRDGQIIKTRQNKYQLVRPQDLIQGRVIGHKEGYGFIAPQDGTSHIFISAREMRKTIDGDLVNIRLTNVDRNNRREGVIVDIIEHTRKQIVGHFFVENGVGFVYPDNKRINQDIIIPPKEQLNAKHGQIVIAEIVAPPTLRTNATGKIIEILGDYMSPGMEIETTIRSYDIPHQWKEMTLKEASALSDQITEENKKGRADLRNLPLVTIDSEDAKDFDDAVYCEKRKKGGWRLIVAIADVSHYVKPNTALDIEAKERGNSVYFPGKVVPMLPYDLSNDICSLNPKVDRLCVACDMALRADGKIERYRFYSAIMRSHARLTYKKVTSLLNGKNAQINKQHQNLLPHIKNLHQLYRVLFQLRCKRGALDFETQEIKIEFGKGRKIKRLIPIIRQESHKIIEECMLCANTCAAKFLLKNQSNALYRIHDGPKIDKLIALKEFLGELGLSLGGGELPLPIDYAKLLDKIKERPDAHLIRMVLLKSLSQAFYSPNDDAHFGLSFDIYTHFTSPIRRYPDLIVHRTIRNLITKKQKSPPYSFEELQTLGEHCSMTERRADEATREAINWLKCEYMLDKVGKEFSGVVSHVTGFGIFVELQNIYVEGLIHISTLEDDHYIFDPTRHRLTGKRTGKTYRIGDVLKVKVVRVNLEDKAIDFLLVRK